MTLPQNQAEFDQLEKTLEIFRAGVDKIPAETVAIIAATLSTPEMKSHECVIKAYGILEAVVHGKTFLADPRNPYHHNAPSRTSSGVTNFLRYLYEGEIDVKKIYPAYEYYSEDDDGGVSPVPFEVALKAIDPKPGNATNRLPRFRQWLMDEDKLTAIDPNLRWVELTDPTTLMDEDKLTAIDAGDRIATWKKTGIPWEDFEYAFDSFPKWRKWRTRMERRAAASKSRESKKGKQGRVKSKTDKRKGARPPIGKLKKAIEAS